MTSPSSQQVRDVEDAMLRADVPKMYTGATTLRTPGPGMEFYSLRSTSLQIQSVQLIGRPCKNRRYDGKSED